MSHGRKIAVIGLGYVGLPVAVALARAGAPVTGFDVDRTRIEELRTGRLRRIEGPCLPGFAYRLVVPSSTRPKKGLRLFTAWLREEARVFRDRSIAAG